MKLISYIIIFNFLLLQGCASKPLSEEDKARIKAEVTAYNSEVVAPIYQLIGTTCITRQAEHAWPSLADSTVPGPRSVFSEFASSDINSNYLANFRLKHSNLAWSLKVDSEAEDDSEICQFQLKAGINRNSDIFVINGKIDPSVLHEWQKVSLHEHEKTTMPLTSKVYFLLKMAEQTRPTEPKSKAQELMGNLAPLLIGAGICLLLDVPASDCGLSNSHATSHNIELNQKIKRELAEQELKLKNKLQEMHK